MQVSGKWLAELVDLPKETTTTQIAEKLTAAGLEVEGVVDVGAALKGVVVAKVESCEPHPNADKLKVCKVNDGSAVVDVVCGAANVVAGALVCFATPGTVLPSADGKSGKVIAVAAVRGVTSNGMLCSASELGLEDKTEGLLLLNEGEAGVVVGAPVAAALGKDDVVLTLGVTPNRPDALSHLGVARELSAAFRTRLKAGVPACPERGGPVEQLATVTIEDLDGCARYGCRVIEDVVVGPSPRWVQARLAAVGIRSINNVVDVTNLVMMERGLPLHAFDFDKVAKQGARAAIVVRSARAGEVLVTLDGKERALVGGSDGDVVIADTAPSATGEGRAIALAGVMGGKDTEVTTTTTRILLEAAWFNPSRVRRTARRLDLHSEASKRFERGADPNAVIASLDRAAALIAELSQNAVREGSGREPKGRVARGIVDTYPKRIQPAVVTLRPRKAAQLLGVPAKLVDEASASKLLLSLGLEVEGREAEAIRFRVPTFRPDLTREVDLIEELLRLLGMDQVPTTLPARAGESESVLFDPRRHRALSVAKRALAASGYDEAVNLAFSSSAEMFLFADEATETPDEKKALLAKSIRVQNPLGEERAWLRRSLLQSLAKNAETNHSRGVVDVRLYEAATVFVGKNADGTAPRSDDRAAAAGADAFAIERRRLSGIATGAGAPATFNRREEPLDFFDVKGHLEEVFEQLRIPAVELTAASRRYLHPRSAAELRIDGRLVGVVGELHPSLVDFYNLRTSAIVFDLDVDALAAAAQTTVTTKPLPRFPSVRRDFALVVDETLPAATLRARFADNVAARDLLESVSIFDVYQGKGVAAGKKSVAVAVTLRADDRTLTDADVQRLSDALIADVKQLGAEIR